MYTVYIKTHEGEKKSYTTIDKNYAKEIFYTACFALDMKSVDFCDAVTGEVLAAATNEGSEINVEYFDDELLNETIAEIFEEEIK